MPIEVREIVEWYLRARGFDGLFSGGDCACLVGDLMPCCDEVAHCQPGYKSPCDCGEHDFHVGAERVAAVPAKFDGLKDQGVLPFVGGS